MKTPNDFFGWLELAIFIVGIAATFVGTLWVLVKGVVWVFEGSF